MNTQALPHSGMPGFVSDGRRPGLPRVNWIYIFRWNGFSQFGFSKRV